MNKKKYLQLKLFGLSSGFFAFFSVIPLLANTSFGFVVIAFLGNVLKWALILSPLPFLLNWPKQYLSHQSKPSQKKSRRLYRFLLGSLLLIWCMAFLIFYPGTFGADAPGQLGMVQGLISLSTHHPLLHTLLFGNLITWTAKFLGSANLGLAIYILVFQIFFTAYAISKAICSLYLRNVPAWLLIGSTFFLALNPFVMALVCYTTKDIPFAAALLLFMVYLGELLYPSSKKQSFTSDLGQAFLWGLLMSLLRSQGIYMLVMSIIVLLFQYRKRLHNRRFLIIESLQIVIFVLVLTTNTLIHGLGGVEKADFREALSVPIQQIATILQENAESSNPFLDEELVNQALSYFEDYTVDRINPYSADDAKLKFVTERVKQHPFQFIQTYLKLLMSDFLGAIRAYVRLIGPYFNMRLSDYNSLIVLYVPELPQKPYGIQEQSLFPTLREKLATLIYRSSNAYGEPAPIWLGLFDPAWILYLIFFLLEYALIYKEKRLSFLLIYPISYILTMFLGPVSLLRYSYVYLMEGPYLLGSFWLVLSKKSKTPKKKANI